MMDVLFTELVRPSLDFDRTNGDPLLYLGPILCVISVGGNRPLIVDLVSTFLPQFMGPSGKVSDPAEVYQLCGLIKASLILLAEVETGQTGAMRATERLIRTLSENLEELEKRARVSEGGGTMKRKRKKSSDAGERPLGSGQKAILEVVSKVLRSDEELRARWPGLI